MNAKVQETINDIATREKGWPNIYAYDDEKYRKETFQKHSKLEWAFIYKECAKIKGFWGDLRNLGYEDKNWYDECYDRKEIKEGYFPYIPFEPNRFYRLIKKLTDRFSFKSFLDVGAGYGDKVLIAKEVFEKADGIEYLEEYVKVGKTFGVDLICGDAFEFQNYKNYDLLYMYHPIYDDKLYKKLVIHLLEEMKVGGYLLEVYDPHEIFLDAVIENKEKLNLRIITRSGWKNGVLIKKKGK